MSEKALEILKTYFGYDSFRNGQEEIINSILAGRDALAIMPTGAGKSICYQVPALMLSGITLVISPLISLMQDQVKALNEAGIHAAFINSSLTETQISKALNLASKGTYKIIYVAPERLESMGFMQFAMNTDISMITVDEAHCISQWGQDFRPSYLKIVDFIEHLHSRPVISAFTATATQEVKTDIECILKLKNPDIVVTGFDRENLYYSVEHISGKSKDTFVMDYIERHPNESGIIYCATRKNVDALYENLFKSGISVTSYHAGISNEMRKKNQDDFIYDRVNIMVATNAFGMGIDKSNVRFVIHYNMPQSMENYYQEAGRAGRDGGNSQCILLFAAQDVMINKFLLDKKEFEGTNDTDTEAIKQRDLHRLRAMEGYCKTTSCLRNYILEYFGEKTYALCDNCGNCQREYLETDMTYDARQVINCIAEMKGRYGQNIVIGTLLGADRARLREIGAKNYRSFGVLSNRNENEIRLLINQMSAEGYIFQTEGEYSLLQIGNIDRLRDEETRVMVRHFEERQERSSSGRTRKKSTDSLTSKGFDLFERLRALRLTIAKEEAMPPYIIFSDKTLIDMCAKMPVNEQQMLTVSGVAQTKFNKYGQRFIDEIAKFMSENPEAVVSVRVGEDDSDSGNEENAVKKSKKKREKKSGFFLNPEDVQKYEYTGYCYISDIRDKLNSICSATNVKKVTYTAIWEYLVKEGLTVGEQRGDRYIKKQTKRGLELGIKTENRIGKSGFEYELLVYPEEVQRMIAEHFVGTRQENED